MGNLAGLYDQDTAPDATDYDLIPPGEYEGDIVKAELKDTRAGCMISLQIKLDSGRYVFDNLNIKCATSETAEKMAQAALKRIGQSNNRIIQDTSDLEMCRVRAAVGVQPPKDGYDARNVVKRYLDLKGSAPSASAARTAPRPQAPKPAGSAPKPAAPASNGGNRWLRGGKPEDSRTSEEVLDDEIPF
ncbi:hypothetical protein SRCM100623_00950 [Acetobacter pasteurianus]|uniref:DUF669 domain-containing protein n=1 Tax=Acetobacter pasteurianus TaxID=438 RepID=A0A1A0DC46_ACEPA|nr:hypothetical protein [Acetobacter pasteurianus]OAZ72411.1 hypothetical protein SRCM100623_00950 [Acetobacter pasteurianus]